MAKFEWHNSELLKVNGKDVDTIMDSEDSTTIYGMCDILQKIMDYGKDNDIDLSILSDNVKSFIEDEALMLIPDYLL